MEMTGEQLIPADREAVWNALNDPEVLKQCIPGCQDLEKTEDDNGFAATVQAKVGPVKAKFKGTVTLSNIDAPNSYTISGEGKGGAAGFAKGSADVSLEEAGDGTLLKYAVNAKVGGKLAQIGSRLIDSTAKKLSGEFFENFSAVVAGPGAADSEAVTQEEPAPPEPVAAAAAPETEKIKPKTAPKPSSAAPELQGKMVPILGLHPFFWTIGLVAIVIVLIYGFSGAL